jgi:hypothetical protein
VGFEVLALRHDVSYWEGIHEQMTYQLAAQQLLLLMVFFPTDWSNDE